MAARKNNGTGTGNYLWLRSNFYTTELHTFWVFLYFWDLMSEAIKKIVQIYGQNRENVLGLSYGKLQGKQNSNISILKFRIV